MFLYLVYNIKMLMTYLDIGLNIEVKYKIILIFNKIIDS